MHEFPIITESSSLQNFASELRAEKEIAIDLEADSMHSYQEKVCLLQFSTSKGTVLVDPLSCSDLSPLQPVLENCGIRKIFHAADYDIRSLFRDFRITVCGLFDTMICCQFLGEEKVGLNDVLNKYFGVVLDKKFQRADWSRRPLSDEMIRYAAEDTRHLIKLSAILEEKLAAKGRLDWVREEFSILENVRPGAKEPTEPLFLRVKGAWKLSGRELAILERLLQWRDREARRRDCPLFKVIGANELIALARQAPTRLEELKAVSGLGGLVQRYGSQMIKEIRPALAIADKDLPVYPEPLRSQKNPAAENRLKRVKNWRTIKAGELGMDPGIVINNSLLEEISSHPPADLGALQRIPSFKKWQIQELGPELVRVLGQS